MSSSWTGHHQPSPEQVLALAPPRPKPPTPHVHLAGGSGMAPPPGSRSGIRPVFRTYAILSVLEKIAKLTVVTHFSFRFSACEE